jgi:hypothetical protein
VECEELSDCIPYKLIDDPIRKHDRKLTADAISTKSRIERELPNLEQPYILAEDPILANDLRLTAEPIVT